MHNKWYADPPDLVKWNAVAHIARRGARRTGLLYVPMLRAKFALPPLHRNGAPTARSSRAVSRHFRDVQSLQHLADLLSVRWRIVDRLFSERTRTTYFRHVGSHIEAMKTQGLRVIAVVDPDTGVAPRRSTANADAEEYVTADDLGTLFAQLRRGDVLTVYQHIYRGGKAASLIAHALARFESAFPPSHRAHLDAYTMPEFTKEAVMLTATKKT